MSDANSISCISNTNELIDVLLLCESFELLDIVDTVDAVEALLIVLIKDFLCEDWLSEGIFLIGALRLLFAFEELIGFFPLSESSKDVYLDPDHVSVILARASSCALDSSCALTAFSRSRHFL